LKQKVQVVNRDEAVIAPITGARIETSMPLLLCCGVCGSPPSRGRGLKPSMMIVPFSTPHRPHHGGAD